jgi:hypothetical protein
MSANNREVRRMVSGHRRDTSTAAMMIRGNQRNRAAPFIAEAFRVPRWSYTLRGANWANVVDGFDHRPWARRLASVGEAHLPL